jgi:hypothetical protein
MGESPAGGPAGEAAQRPGVRVSQHGGLRIPGQRKIGGFGTFWNLWHLLGPFWGSERHLWQHLQQTGPWYPLIGVPCKLARPFYTKSLVFGICLGGSTSKRHPLVPGLWSQALRSVFDSSLSHRRSRHRIEGQEKAEELRKESGSQEPLQLCSHLDIPVQKQASNFRGQVCIVPSARHFSFFHGSFGISDSKIVWTCLLASSIFFSDCLLH